MQDKKEVLKEKIQVLLSSEDLNQLNNIIIRKAILSNTRPKSISFYVRSLIKEHILANQPEQKSIVKENIKKITKK